MTDKCGIQMLHRVCDTKALCVVAEGIHAQDMYDIVASHLRWRTGRCTMAIPVQERLNQHWVLYIPCLTGMLESIMLCAMISLAMAAES